MSTEISAVPLVSSLVPSVLPTRTFVIDLHLCCFCLTDIIDENLKTALQKDLNAMAPGLTIQVWFLLLCFFTLGYQFLAELHTHMIYCRLCESPNLKFLSQSEETMS